MIWTWCVLYRIMTYVFNFMIVASRIWKYVRLNPLNIGNVWVLNELPPHRRHTPLRIEVYRYNNYIVQVCGVLDIGWPMFLYILHVYIIKIQYVYNLVISMQAYIYIRVINVFVQESFCYYQPGFHLSVFSPSPTVTPSWAANTVKGIFPVLPYILWLAGWLGHLSMSDFHTTKSCNRQSSANMSKTNSLVLYIYMYQQLPGKPLYRI